MKTNAKNEFIEHVADRALLCAVVMNHGNSHLPINYSAAQYEAFLTALDFHYDSGYGGQELYGTIWYTDGTWSERGEYDGSEWWAHNVCPAVPEVLGGAK